MTFNVIPHFSFAIVFVVCGTSSRHVIEMKNCVIEMMNQRRRCQYYARGETWHEETFNVRHVYSTISHKFSSPLDNPQWIMKMCIKKCYKCAH